MQVPIAAELLLALSGGALFKVDIQYSKKTQLCHVGFLQTKDTMIFDGSIAGSMSVRHGRQATWLDNTSLTCSKQNHLLVGHGTWYGSLAASKLFAQDASLSAAWIAGNTTVLVFLYNLRLVPDLLVQQRQPWKMATTSSTGIAHGSGQLDTNSVSERAAWLDA